MRTLIAQFNDVRPSSSGYFFRGRATGHSSQGDWGTKSLKCFFRTVAPLSMLAYNTALQHIHSSLHNKRKEKHEQTQTKN